MFGYKDDESSPHTCFTLQTLLLSGNGQTALIPPMSNHVYLIHSVTEPNKHSDILRDLKKLTYSNIIKAIIENTKESRKSCLPELQAGMLWIFKDAGEKNNRNKLPSLPERGWG